MPIPRSKEDSEAYSGTFLNAVEANKLLDAFTGHRLQSLLYVTLYYGLRRSEVLGLKWNAVDLETNTIKICHVVVKTSSIEAKDRTKSQTSRRTYSLKNLATKYQSRATSQS